MGASGIVTTSILSPVATLSNVSNRWKFVFIGSFVAAVNAMVYIAAVRDQVLLAPSTSSPLAYVIGGFCVGLGTKLGNGCTSGHGVCGLARFSPRSFASVMTFLVSGILTTTFISSPNTPWAASTAFLRQEGSDMSTNTVLSSTILLFSVGMALLSSVASDDGTKSQQGESNVLPNQRKSYGAAISGAMFAIGLAISGMSKTSKVQGFLDLNPLFRSNVTASYDPTLLTVLGSAVPVSALGYLWQRYRMKHTTWCGTDWSCIPNRTDIDAPLLLGSVLFGVGWGLVGLCPGPGVWSAGAGAVDVIYSWFPAFLFGSFVGKQLLNTPSKPKTN